jgi:hypothetical protein
VQGIADKAPESLIGQCYPRVCFINSVVEQRIRGISSLTTCNGRARATTRFRKKAGPAMFLILGIVLVVLWLGGFFLLHVSSFLIHLLLILAVISMIMNFVSGKRSV